VNNHRNDPGLEAAGEVVARESGRPAAITVTCPDRSPAGANNHFGVRVPTPGSGDIVVDVRARRADVVNRLLEMGVSRCTLITLLPDWSDLIILAASEHAQTR
jgi:hypothetical protein